ncbi:MAG TPA: MFS transporter [Gaiellales bacterium]|nr:MFS transporter [Gaiellales bacterium]
MTDDHPNRRWWTLFAMCFALFMIMLDNTVVNVALPSIQRSLKTTPQNLEWTVNAYVLSFASLILLGGKLGDRFGRKRIFLVGLALFTLSSAACALSTTDAELISFRVIQGAGGAMLNPLSLSIIVAAFPRRQLPTAIGVWAGISGLGLAVGPLAGGFLVEHYSWSYVFWINVPIGVIAAAATAWAVVESRDPGARSLDVTGTLLVTGGLFSLVWALIKTGSDGWLSGPTLGFLAAAAVLLAAFVVWESRSPQPMLPLGFFRRRAFSSSSVVVMLVGFGLFGVIYFITLYFQNVKGYSPLQAGARSLPMTMMLMVFAPIGGRLNQRVGARALMTVGMLLAGGGLFGLSHVQPDSSYNLIWPMYVLMGIGMALTMPAVSSTGMAAVDHDKAGIASGVINASRQVGGALGIAVLGSIGTTVAAGSWQAKAAALAPAHRAATLRLTPLVEGGQSRLIGHLAGASMRAAANDSFVEGVRRAMLVGSGMMLLAGLVAFLGLRHVRLSRPVEQPVAVEA